MGGHISAWFRPSLTTPPNSTYQNDLICHWQWTYLLQGHFSKRWIGLLGRLVVCDFTMWIMFFSMCLTADKQGWYDHTDYPKSVYNLTSVWILYFLWKGFGYNYILQTLWGLGTSKMQIWKQNAGKNLLSEIAIL